MKRVLVYALAVLAAAGCAASRGAGVSSEGTVTQSPSDRARLWNAALEVVSARFPVKSAEEASGRIETDYLVGPLSQTGFKSNAVRGGDLAYDSLHTIRRRAIVTVHPDGGPVDVEIERERRVRAGYQEPLPPGVYSLDISGREQDRNMKLRWVDNGRDGPLEEVVAREITERYRAGAR